MLNRTLIAAYERTQPPMVGGKRLKMFYSTQINSKPLIIRVFVNDPQRMVDAYKSYLIRVLRSNFELDGLPLILQFRARPRGEE
jgi:GTP-binding protein